MRTKTDSLKNLWTIFCALALAGALLACGSDGQSSSPDTSVADGGVDQSELDSILPDDGSLPPDASPDLPPVTLPELGNLTLYANLGDSIAASFGASVGYRDLLMQNDDEKYPEFKGKDFSTLFADISFSDRSYAGATSSNVVQQSKLVPANPSGTTLVIISAGGNDVLNDYTVMLDPAKVQVVAKKVTDNLGAIMNTFSDKNLFPEPVHFAVLNVYDLSDGTGLLPADEPVVELCATLRALGPVVGTKLVASLKVLNDAIAAFVAAKGAMLIDIHQHFLGHGFNYKDEASAYHDPDDATLWFQYDCLHPTERGHHEIRRVIWKRLFGE